MNKDHTLNDKHQLQFLASSRQKDCNAVIEKYFDNYYTIQLITSGELFLAYDNNECVIKAPCIFTCYPGVRIRFHKMEHSVEPWEHYHIAFRGSKVQEWTASGLFFHGEKQLDSLDQYLEKMISIMDIYNTGEAWAIERICARIESLLADLAHDQHHQHKPKWLKVCIENITLYETPDYQQLARKCHCSLSHLRKMFREVMGVSMHNYWLAMRLRRACEMMNNEKNTLETIALDLGYNDGPFFSKQFKKHYGVNPKDYRKSLFDFTNHP